MSYNFKNQLKKACSYGQYYRKQGKFKAGDAPYSPPTYQQCRNDALILTRKENEHIDNMLDCLLKRLGSKGRVSYPFLRKRLVSAYKRLVVDEGKKEQDISSEFSSKLVKVVCTIEKKSFTNYFAIYTEMVSSAQPELVLGPIVIKENTLWVAEKLEQADCPYYLLTDVSHMITHGKLLGNAFCAVTTEGYDELSEREFSRNLCRFALNSVSLFFGPCDISTSQEVFVEDRGIFYEELDNIFDFATFDGRLHHLNSIGVGSSRGLNSPGVFIGHNKILRKIGRLVQAYLEADSSIRNELERLAWSLDFFSYALRLRKNYPLSITLLMISLEILFECDFTSIRKDERTNNIKDKRISNSEILSRAVSNFLVDDEKKSPESTQRIRLIISNAYKVRNNLVHGNEIFMNRLQYFPYSQQVGLHDGDNIFHNEGGGGISGFTLNQVSVLAGDCLRNRSIFLSREISKK